MAVTVYGESLTVPATTNLCTNGGFETNKTGWTGTFGTETLTRITTDAKFGTACLSLTVAAADGRAQITPSFVNPPQGTTYSMSVWVKAGNGAAVGKTAHIRLNETGGASGNAAMFTVSVVLTNLWQRVIAAGTVVAVGRTGLIAYVGEIGTGTAGDIVLIDGVQVEQKSIATPYVETNGATASRLASGGFLSTATTAGILGAYGASSAAFAAAVATAGVPTKFTTSTASSVLTATTVGQLGAKAVSTQTLTIGIATAGVPTFIGASSAAFVISVATSGTRTTLGTATIEDLSATVELTCVSARAELATDGASVSLSDSLLGQ